MAAVEKARRSRTVTVNTATTVQLLRRASEVLAGTRRHLALELSERADRFEKLLAEAKARCGDIHRMGCACAVLAEINSAGSG